MSGYILLADGTRLDGRLIGSTKTVTGYALVNTAVVGFQEMVTDPAYKGALLAFTYPEIGNVGVTADFAESSEIQPAGLVVKVLSEFRTNYHSEHSLEEALAQAGVPCLTDVDTRALAVHLREHGEMPAAIASSEVDPVALQAQLAAMDRPAFAPTPTPALPQGQKGPKVAVIDLGIRRSELEQLALCCRPKLFAYDASAETILADKPAGVFISDGPTCGRPAAATVETIKGLLGQVPILGCGLGHVALGLATSCEASFLKRGQHGVNFPVRWMADDTIELTCQRHSVVLDRASVEANPAVELVAESIGDGSVQAIRSADGKARGLQAISAADRPGAVNPHIRDFVTGL